MVLETNRKRIALQIRRAQKCLKMMCSDAPEVLLFLTAEGC